MTNTYQGSLFSSDFLTDSIARLPEWAGVDDATLDALSARLGQVFAHFPTKQTPNESQTEDDLIWPILEALGWTAMRSMIAAIISGSGVGNTFPILLGAMGDGRLSAQEAAAFLANFNATIFDFVARQKIQGQHLNWYIVEQLPVVPLANYAAKRFGKKSVADIVREAVLELTYTAHDMAPFARDMGFVDKAGQVKPPFKWDEARRVMLRAKLDAIYFHLYGITDRDDVRYIYSTFPIIERDETAAHGRYLSRDLCLAWMSALAAGNPDAEIKL